MRLRYLLAGAALAVAGVSAALADYTIKDSNATTRTIFAFVCQTTKICPAHVLIKSDGTEINPAAAGQLPAALTGSGNLAVALQETNIAGSTPVLLNALGTSVTTVKASAGRLVYLHCWNPNAAAAYVQVFDISGSVTLGTSTPKLSMAVPPTNSNGFVLPLQGIAFANAIKAAATSTATGSTTPGTALDCNAATL